MSRESFYLNQISNNIKDKEAKILVVGAGELDRKVFDFLKFNNVTFSNLNNTSEENINFYENMHDIKFNDNAFEEYTGPEKLDNVIELKNGQPMLFAKETKGLKLEGAKAIVVDMEKHSVDEILVHDETDLELAHIIANWTSNPNLPEPIGVIYSIDKPTYNQDMVDQINHAKDKKGLGNVQDLLNAGDTWKVD